MSALTSWLSHLGLAPEISPELLAATEGKVEALREVILAQEGVISQLDLVVQNQASLIAYLQEQLEEIDTCLDLTVQAARVVLSPRGQPSVPLEKIRRAVEAVVSRRADA